MYVGCHKNHSTEINISKKQKRPMKEKKKKGKPLIYLIIVIYFCFNN